MREQSEASRASHTKQTAEGFRGLKEFGGRESIVFARVDEHIREGLFEVAEEGWTVGSRHLYSGQSRA
jgi:hypothetical protein